MKLQPKRNDQLNHQSAHNSILYNFLLFSISMKRKKREKPNIDPKLLLHFGNLTWYVLLLDSFNYRKPPKQTKSILLEFYQSSQTQYNPQHNEHV